MDGFSRRTCARTFRWPHKFGIASGHRSAGKPGRSAGPRPGHTTSSPRASASSICTTVRQPLTTESTISASETPRPRTLESSDAVPPRPRTLSCRTLQISLKSLRELSNGTLTVMLARRPEPRFEGHEEMNPRRSLRMKARPCCASAASKAECALQSRAKASAKFAPGCLTKSFKWSSSLTHAASSAFSSAKTPRASGQWRPIPEASSMAESGSWKSARAPRRKSSCSCAMPAGFGK
mmetsp:Transcript_4800/g.13234  ORF Transcript_4800/g.13234 Transcript_4800/m.13234 type:complete len:237 (+) Transcript_4800:1092-1802(+)